MFSDRRDWHLWKIPQNPQSMNIRHSLTFVVTLLCVASYVSGQEVKPTSAPVHDQALEILDAARAKIRGYSSIRAKLSEKVTLRDHSFSAKGSYLQGKNLQLRMEFSLELGGNKGSLLEVCDGQVLWTRHDVGEQIQVTRRDVQQILDAASKSGLSIPQTTMVTNMGLGGVPALLAAFSKDFEFTRVADDVIDEKPVILLEGTWSQTYKDQWLGKKETRKSGQELPLFIPDSVRIALDPETQFPRRIVYLKTIPDRNQGQPGPLLSLDFTEVKFNQKLKDDEEFSFVPPERGQVIDITNDFVRMLQGPATAPAATKTAP